VDGLAVVLVAMILSLIGMVVVPILHPILHPIPLAERIAKIVQFGMFWLL
jgi:hypothetical protein